MLEKGSHHVLQHQGLLSSTLQPNPTSTFIYIYADFEELGSFYYQSGAITCPVNISSFVSGVDSCPLSGQAILGNVDKSLIERRNTLRCEKDNRLRIKNNS